MALSLDCTLFDHFREMRTPDRLEPEKALVVKALEDALETFAQKRFPKIGKPESQQTRSRRLEEYREARRWIFAPDDPWVFSFTQCCEWLDIDPVYLRGQCRKYDRDVESGKRRKDEKRQRGRRHEAARAMGWGR